MTKGEERVRATMEEAEEILPEPPRPLFRETEAAEPFPIDALGPVLAPAAKAIHDRVQAPMALCAQSVLAAAALATQAHADVVLPTGHAKPLSCFFLTIAASGERKSACDHEALWPIRTRESALRTAYEAQLSRYLNDQAAWEQQRSQILHDKKRYATWEVKRHALDTLGPAPEKPLVPILTVPEPTYEGLCRLLQQAQPSIGLFSGEGGSFIGGYGMSDDAKLRTAAGLSSLWDGEPIRRVRAGDGTTVLPGRRLSMHLMVQPDVAATVLSDRVLIDQGLLSRVLVTAPATAAGTRFWHEEKPESDAALKRYGARLLSILESPLPLAAEKLNELEPRRLPLSPEARELWVGFANHVEASIGAGGEMEAIRGLANKLPEHAARLAAVLALVDDIGTAAIGRDQLAAAIVIVQHHAGEALRLFAAGAISPNLRLAEKLRIWLLTGWPEPVVSLPDIYRLGPNAIREKATAQRLVRILEEHGWLTSIPEGATVADNRRREAWRIVGKG